MDFFAKREALVAAIALVVGSAHQAIAELDKVESRIIRMALAHSRGNKSQTARLLRLRRSTLVDHMGRLGLTGDGKTASG